MPNWRKKGYEMCKAGGLLIAYVLDQHRALVTDADCDSWKCPECRERLRQRWVLTALHGARVLQDRGDILFFATLTSHEENTTFNTCARAFPDAWRQLHKRLNQQRAQGQYLLVPEKHKDGRLHMHALWNYPVSTRWLKDNGRACGFGYMNQIGSRGHIDEPINDAREVGQYIGKYLGKQLGDDLPPRFRRVRTSQAWAHLPAPITASQYDWHYVNTNGKLQTVYEACRRDNLALVDIRTGEVFDDVDLGTIISA